VCTISCCAARTGRFLHREQVVTHRRQFTGSNRIPHISKMLVLWLLPTHHDLYEPFGRRWRGRNGLDAIAV
jgi:hypothetical protein